MNVFPASRGVQRSVVLLTVVALASGCSWFKSRNDYLGSPESPPLEVPPALDAPVTDPSMAIPAVSASGTSPRTPSPATNAMLESAAFTVADSQQSAWNRVGLALERIDGVVVVDRATALSAYNVRFDGQEFLIRIVASGAGSRIEAVDAGGGIVTSSAAARVLGALRARLG